MTQRSQQCYDLVWAPGGPHHYTQAREQQTDSQIRGFPLRSPWRAASACGSASPGIDEHLSRVLLLAGRGSRNPYHLSIGSLLADQVGRVVWRAEAWTLPRMVVNG